MPRCESTQFGPIDYDEAAVVHFPAGLPAFEGETRFLLIEQTETAPVVFLQSLATATLVFICLPARLVDPAFQLQLTDEERTVLGLAATNAAGDAAPVEGRDLISLAILTIRAGERVTANLLAPVVIGAATRRALQVVQPESGYRVDEPLGEAVGAC